MYDYALVYVYHLPFMALQLILLLKPCRLYDPCRHTLDHHLTSAVHPVRCIQDMLLVDCSFYLHSTMVS